MLITIQALRADVNSSTVACKLWTYIAVTLVATIVIEQCIGAVAVALGI